MGILENFWKPRSFSDKPKLGEKRDFEKVNLKNKLSSKIKKEPNTILGKSIIGKKPGFVSAEDFKKRLERDSGNLIFKKDNKFDKNRRKQLATDIITSEMGQNIDIDEVKKAREQLNLGSQGKYKNVSPEERKQLKEGLDMLLEEENPEEKS
ncbi:MAG: hypothetical protein V1756_01070 [Patescibacteria group bacterium]